MENSRTNIRQHILCTAKTIILGKGFAAVGLNEILTTAQRAERVFLSLLQIQRRFW